MRTDNRWWHGGVPGLRVGDILLPGNERRTHEGCEWCEARKKGQAYFGMDPPSARRAVYITHDKEYARFYASLYGYGDLYIVEPNGQAILSEEDHIEAWSADSARILAVYQRAVRLTMTQRRALQRKWKVADERALERGIEAAP